MRSLSFAVFLMAVMQSTSGFLFNQRETLFVGSFNIQSLGPTKMARPEFVSTVVRILSRYDIVLIQEIKDSSTNNTVFQVLIDELNKYVKTTGVKYDYRISPRLGKTSYKEQKAYLYRNSQKADDGSRRISITNDYVYNDVEGVYDRPPYVSHFSLSNSGLPVTEFTMINLHLRPDNVLNESLALRGAIKEINYKYNDNILIMGDMNFDCKYMSGVKREKVRQELAEFTFYINDDISTTTSDAFCALDRILISGVNFKNSVVSGSNSTYLYYPQMNLTLQQADAISDHYPVEIKFTN